MTSIFKTTALAALVATASLPAYAAAHLDISRMTCNEYEDLSRADRNKVAVMAVSEMSGASVVVSPNATATGDTVTRSSGESPAGVADTSAEATTIANAGDHMTRFEEEIKIMNGICTFNPTTTVMEAAAGQFGKR